MFWGQAGWQALLQHARVVRQGSRPAAAASGTTNACSRWLQAAAPPTPTCLQTMLCAQVPEREVGQRQVSSSGVGCAWRLPGEAGRRGAVRSQCRADCTCCSWAAPSVALELLLGQTCPAAAAAGLPQPLPATTHKPCACFNYNTCHTTLLQVLFLVGWQQHGDTLSLPADAPLGPLQAVASRLKRLADKKGHSGEAVAVEPAGQDGSRPPSQYYGTPGFQYQEQASLGAWPLPCARFECIWLNTAVGSQDAAGAGAAASCTEPAIPPCSVPHLHCCRPALCPGLLCPSMQWLCRRLTLLLACPPCCSTDFPLLTVRPPHQRRKRAAVDPAARLAAWEHR